MSRSFSGGSLLRLRTALTVFALGTALASAGCDPAQQPLMTKPAPVPLRLAIPDREYRLAPADRAKMLPGFDVDALERLLAMTNPDLRHEILAHFQVREKGSDPGILVELFDPELQKVLEEVWAPMWEHVRATDAEIEMDAYHYPGREIAKQRRAARARVKPDGSQ